MRPNILFVVFDSLGQTDFEALVEELPTLSTLCEKSLSFSNAYVCSPESGPARASLFTGLDMAAHDVWTDGVALPARETPFPEQFAINGYKTALVGRRQLAGVSNWTTEHPRPQEYTHFEWAHGPLHRSRQNAYLIWLQEIAPETYAKIFPNQPNPDAAHIPAWQHEAMKNLPDTLSFNTWAGTQARALLTEHISSDPFLGVVGFVVGKTMGAAPNLGSRIEGLNKTALRQADIALGKILRDISDDTVIVVTAGRGSQSDTGTGHPLHDAAIKVPMMIRHPDHSAQTVKGAVSTMDIAPTLYEIAKLRPPQRMQGASLLARQPRGWALSRLRALGEPHQTALRTGHWKLIMAHGQLDKTELPSYHLYDLNTDPDETQDLAANPVHSQTLESLIDLMIDARVALEDRTEPRIAKF